MTSENSPPEVRVSNWTMATGTGAGERLVFVVRWKSDLPVALSQPDYRSSDSGALPVASIADRVPAKAHLERRLARCLLVGLASWTPPVVHRRAWVAISHLWMATPCSRPNAPP
jgi:hypothetical protein